MKCSIESVIKEGQELLSFYKKSTTIILGYARSKDVSGYAIESKNRGRLVKSIIDNFEKLRKILDKKKLKKKSSKILNYGRKHFYFGISK